MDVMLILFKETGERKDFPLKPGKTIIGRKEDCDLRIPLAEISRKHAMIMVDEKSVTIRDMGSSNGTYINNQKISEQEISAGDHIVIGPVVLTAQIDGQPADIKPVHTRLEAREPAITAANVDEEPLIAKSDTVDSQDIITDDEDPISALEALAGTDDTAAIDIDESTTETEE